jgi:hypothetical protein
VSYAEWHGRPVRTVSFPQPVSGGDFLRRMKNAMADHEWRQGDYACLDSATGHVELNPPVDRWCAVWLWIGEVS